MADVSRKDFLGLSTVAAAGLASGCAPIADPDLIKEIQVIQTVLGGRTVHEA